MSSRKPKAKAKESKASAPPAKKKGRGGRPALYQDSYAEQARKLCMLGAIDEQLADFFEVSRRTLDSWKIKHPEFLRSLKEGKSIADANVASSLYHRAVGYSHKAVKIFGDVKTGDDLVVEYTERYAPDTTACIFWLKNRRPDLWRDRQHVEAEIKDLDRLSDEELERLASGEV